MNKKSLSLLSLLILSKSAGASMYLSPDTTPPTYDKNSFKLSAKTVEAGKSITISVAAKDDNSGMLGDGQNSNYANQNGYLWIEGPTGSTKVDPGWGVYDSNSGTITFSVKLTQYAMPGTYKISTIGWLRDNAGNSSGMENIKDLHLDFEVLNHESIDVTAPQFDKSTFQLSSTSIKAGESVTITVKAKDDNSGMLGDGQNSNYANQNGYLWIEGPTGSTKVDPGWGVYDSNSGTITFSVKLTQYAMPGTYKISTIGWLRDNAGNSSGMENIKDLHLEFSVSNP